MDVEKSQRVLPLFFFGIETFSKIYFHKSSPNSPILGNFEVLLLFLSLGYGADLGRSRFVALSVETTSCSGDKKQGVFGGDWVVLRSETFSLKTITKCSQ